MRQIRDIFGQNLEAARTARGLSREKLSEIVKLDPITIRNYEKGYRWPGPDSIQALSSALQVPEAQFFERPEAKPVLSPKDAVAVICEALGLEAELRPKPAPRLVLPSPKPGPAPESPLKSDLLATIDAIDNPAALNQLLTAARGLRDRFAKEEDQGGTGSR